MLSNHFHLVLRSRPDVVQTWDDTEVARRWLTLCPPRKGSAAESAKLTEADLDRIRRNPQRLAEIRRRLSDISWWMRLLSQPLAARANKEENETGRFWQGRFRAVRLCDEAALVACTAYVALNLIRAGLAKTLEGSRFTSVHRRIAALRTAATDPAVQTAPGGETPDRFLAPLEINERQDAIGAVPSRWPHRASDKGFLPMTSAQYFNLLDWTARHVVRGKPGVTPNDAPAVLQRLGIPLEDWSNLVCDFGRLFYLVAGRPATLSTIRSRLSHRPFHIPRAAQQLLSASA